MKMAFPSCLLSTWKKMHAFATWILVAKESSRTRGKLEKRWLEFCFSYTERIIALQCWVGFNMNQLYVPSLLNLPSTSHPIPPSRSSGTPGLSSLCCPANSHWLSVLHMVMCVCSCCFLICPTVSFPCCVCKSVLYVSASLLLSCR